MSHRAQIRSEFKSLLTGKTMAGANVFTSRSVPVRAENMPAILVYIGDEQRHPDQKDGNSVRRNVNVVLECAVAGKDAQEVEAQIEQFATDVEEIVDRDGRTLNDIAHNVTWYSSNLDIATQAQVIFGAARLEYTVDIYTQAHDGRVRSALPNFDPSALPSEVFVHGELVEPTTGFEHVVQPIDQLLQNPDNTPQQPVGDVTTEPY